MGFSCGIDLGTTNTTVSIARIGINNTVEVNTEDIPQIAEDGMNMESSKTLPSVLSVTDGICNVGLVARAMKGQSVNRVIWNSKNFIGEAQYSWEIDGVEYTPELVASYFLSAVRKHLLAMYNDEESLKNVVITVPASFNLDQRNATKSAAKLAGFNDKVILISEPTAAILDFINEQTKLSDEAKYMDFSSTKNVLVFDLGGGTCDVAVLKIKINGKEVYVEEDAVSPHTLIGGSNFDAYAVEGIVSDFEKENKVNLRDALGKENFKILRSKLLVYVEKAKIFFSAKHFQLSNMGKTDEEIENMVSFPIQIPSILNGSPFKIDLSMSKYNGYISTLLTKDNSSENVIKPIEKTLESSELRVDEIDYLFLVGGMTNYPKVKNVLRDYFKKEPLKFTDSMYSVSRGASIYNHYDVIEKKLSDEGKNDGTTNNIYNSVDEKDNKKTYDIIPVIPQTIYLNVKNGFPIPLIEAKTKAGTPIVHDGIIEVASDVGVTLELYSGMSIFDPNMKKQQNVRLEFPYGVPVGSKITLKLEYTQEGVLEFEAFVKDHSDIKINLTLEGSQLNDEEIAIIKDKYKINEVGGIL